MFFRFWLSSKCLTILYIFRHSGSQSWRAILPPTVCDAVYCKGSSCSQPNLCQTVSISVRKIRRRNTESNDSRRLVGSTACRGTTSRKPHQVRLSVILSNHYHSSAFLSFHCRSGYKSGDSSRKRRFQDEDNWLINYHTTNERWKEDFFRNCDLFVRFLWVPKDTNDFSDWRVSNYFSTFA